MGELFNYLVERQKSIGGSDIPAIMGLTPWRDGTDVWREKTETLTPEGVAARAENGDMRRGLFMEPVALEMAGSKYGPQYVPAEEQVGLMVQDIEGRPLHASIDAIHIIETIDQVVEIKAPRSYNVRRWMREGLPKYVVAQAMWNGALLGYSGPNIEDFTAEDREDYLCSDSVEVLLPDYDNWDVHQIMVAIDYQLVAKMFAFAEEWWEKHIITGIPPEAEVLAPEVDVAQAGGREISTLGPKWRPHILALKEAYESKAEAEAILAERQATFKQSMDSIELARGQGMMLYYTPQDGRKTMDKKAVEAFIKQHGGNPADFYKTGKPSRPFRPYFSEEKYGA